MKCESVVPEASAWEINLSSKKLQYTDGDRSCRCPWGVIQSAAFILVPDIASTYTIEIAEMLRSDHPGLSVGLCAVNSRNEYNSSQGVYKLGEVKNTW